MHRKSITRELLGIALILILVVVGITALVLAAPDETEESVLVPQTEIVTASSQEEETAQPSAAPVVAAQAQLALSTTECPAASVRFVYSDEFVPYDTVYLDDPTLRKGVEIVDAPGRQGILRATTEIMLHDGKEVARQYVGVTLARESSDRVIRRGTLVETFAKEAPVVTGSTLQTTYAIHKGVGSYDATRNMLSSVTIDKDAKTITTPSGEVFTYSEQLLGEATAYSCEGEINPITYSGPPARVGEVAVDPKFIPIGTKLFIVLQDGSMIYGYCVAEDTGGAVKGNVIDLYVNTFADCSLVGRAPCDVYVLS